MPPPGGVQRTSSELPPGSQSHVCGWTLYGEEENNGGRERKSSAPIQTDEKETDG